MATLYGSDSFCLTDIGKIDLQVTDPRVLIGQRIARRLQTPRGALAAINDDPNFGWDCRQYILAKIGPTEITTAQIQIQAECLKDEQVGSAEVSMSLAGDGALSIAIALETAAGPFLMTLDVSQLTVEAVFSFQ